MDFIDEVVAHSFRASSTTLPLETCLVNSKVVEEIEDDKLKLCHEFIEAKSLVFKPNPTSLKFGKKGHQLSDE